MLLSIHGWYFLFLWLPEHWDLVHPVAHLILTSAYSPLYASQKSTAATAGLVVDSTDCDPLCVPCLHRIIHFHSTLFCFPSISIQTPLKLLSWPTFYPVIPLPSFVYQLVSLNIFPTPWGSFSFQIYITSFFPLYPSICLLHALFPSSLGSFVILYLPSLLIFFFFKKLSNRILTAPVDFVQNTKKEKSLEDSCSQQPCILFIPVQHLSKYSDDTIFSSFDFLKKSHFGILISLAKHAVSLYFQTILSVIT